MSVLAGSSSFCVTVFRVSRVLLVRAEFRAEEHSMGNEALTAGTQDDDMPPAVHRKLRHGDQPCHLQ